MTTFNKDLSPIDQARIILRNYDKVVAERDELKKENERLNMLVEQKDVLYRNMLERMEAKNKQSAIEGEYKHLKKQYDNLNEENEKLKGARLTTFHSKKHTNMNKKTIKQKLRNLKLKATALWWFLTRKNYYLLTYNKGCKSRSLESYNIDILSFIDQVQRWHNMLTAHDILVTLDESRKFGIEDIFVRTKINELIERIKKQDRVYLDSETK